MVNFSKRLFIFNLISFFSALFFIFFRFIFPKRTKRNTIVIIDYKDLQEGVNHFIKYSVIILKRKHTLIVLSDVCTHLGCKVKFIKHLNIFQCPCHKSEYSITGKVLKGPARKDLRRLKFKVVENKIKIIVR